MTSKKCSGCNKEKDISEFYRDRATCKQCIKDQYAQRTDEQKERTRKLARERYKKNKERDRKSNNEYAKKHAQTYGRINYYRQGDGCCFYCWETNPFMLNKHHIWGRKNNKFTITLCEDHHAPLTRGMPFVLEDWYASKETEKNNR